MAGIKQFANGTWQYTFKKAGVLDKPIYLTFESREEGDRYAVKLEKLLAQGIIPTEHRPEQRIMTIGAAEREWQRDAHPSAKDREKITIIAREFADVPLSGITAGWVDAWITQMKREQKLAPNTIRAYVGALARCTDWAMRKGYVQFPDHPLRSLPNGYSQYTKTDAALAGQAKKDIERDRRLERGEYEKILAVIDHGVLPRKQRPFEIPHQDAVRLIFVLALESAMRMREMYTLSMRQVDLARRTVFLDKTKNGDKRQVPLSSVARAALQDYLPGDATDDELVFPFWDGSPDTLADTSDKVSKLFKNIFEVAGCEDLGFHDLRHEATSRLFERTQLSEIQISKITGHKSRAMLMRYANLRGTDLAEQLW